MAVIALLRPIAAQAAPGQVEPTLEIKSDVTLNDARKVNIAP